MSSDSKETLRFQFYSVQDSTVDYHWQKSEANFYWFSGQGDLQSAGGRITGYEDYADVEFWWQNDKDFALMESPEFRLNLPELGPLQIYVPHNGKLVSVRNFGEGPNSAEIIVGQHVQNSLYVNQREGGTADFGFVGVQINNEKFLAIGFRNCQKILNDNSKISFRLDQQSLVHEIWQGDNLQPSKRRAFMRGRIYISTG